jgi:hypothetical protein
VAKCCGLWFAVASCDCSCKVAVVVATCGGGCRLRARTEGKVQRVDVLHCSMRSIVSCWRTIGFDIIVIEDVQRWKDLPQDAYR